METDLKHLAPVQVEETNDWPKPIRISNVRLRRNENFDGDWKEEMLDVNSDHYKTEDHFVWTNQLVVGREKLTLNQCMNKKKTIRLYNLLRRHTNYFVKSFFIRSASAIFSSLRLMAASFTQSNEKL